MDQDKIANLIKMIRKENNLTQKQFADKYGVTYQAVSKWENGINLPDMSLLKKMSEDFNISMDNMLEGDYKPVEKKTNTKFIITIVFLVLFILSLIGLIMIIVNSDDDYEFKTISTQCNDFNITGSLVYTQNRSTIYISDISYCGDNNTKKYNIFKCTLYERKGDIIKEIDSYNSNEDEEILLEDFLKKVTFEIDNYDTLCDKITEDSFVLKIEARSNNDAIDTYRVPLTFKNTCEK